MAIDLELAPKTKRAKGEPCCELVPRCDHVVAVTQIHGLAGRRDELRELMRATE